MMTLYCAFWMFVIIFAFIGAMRGWAKELLVTFGVILALFIISVIERFAPSSLENYFDNNPTAWFWVQTIIVIVLVIFAYQTPKLPRIPSEKFMRDRFSDSLLGFFIGALNGILIVGSIWYFMDQAGYPFEPCITAPPEDQTELLNYLPTKYLLTPGTVYIYIAIAIAFVFVLIVFI